MSLSAPFKLCRADYGLIDGHFPHYVYTVLLTTWALKWLWQKEIFAISYVVIKLQLLIFHFFRQICHKYKR